MKDLYNKEIEKLTGVQNVLQHYQMQKLNMKKKKVASGTLTIH